MKQTCSAGRLSLPVPEHGSRLGLLARRHLSRPAQLLNVQFGHEVLKQQVRPRSEEGDQQRFWKLTRRFIEDLAQAYPGEAPRVRAVSRPRALPPAHPPAGLPVACIFVTCCTSRVQGLIHKPLRLLRA